MQNAVCLRSAEKDLRLYGPPDHVPEYREPDLSQALSQFFRYDDDRIVGVCLDCNAWRKGEAQKVMNYDIPQHQGEWGPL
ncbi:hypothetical protein MRX96_040071 [Rhipicephalus microplus]